MKNDLPALDSLKPIQVSFEATSWYDILCLSTWKRRAHLLLMPQLWKGRFLVFSLSSLWSLSQSRILGPNISCSTNSHLEVIFLWGK